MRYNAAITNISEDVTEPTTVKTNARKGCSCKMQETKERNGVRRFYVTVESARQKIAPIPAMYNGRGNQFLTEKKNNNGVS